METGDRKKGLREKLWFGHDGLEVPGKSDWYTARQRRTGEVIQDGKLRPGDSCGCGCARADTQL